MSYEFIVVKTLTGRFSVDAESEDAARENVRDYAHRIIHVNNQSPWQHETITEVILREE